MLERIDVFSKAPAIRGYSGSTLPEFRILVSGMSLAGCTMQLQIENKYNPGTIVFSKNCTYFSESGEEGYTVQLDSTDTADLSGVYTMYFVLTDTNNGKFYNLVGVLEILPTPKEET